MSFELGNRLSLVEVDFSSSSKHESLSLVKTQISVTHRNTNLCCSLSAEMAATSINSLINGYTWSTPTVNPLEEHTNPMFQSVLGPDKRTFENICEQIPLTFAPNLFEILTASDPPTIDFFKTLPELDEIPNEKLWGVYALLMEKDGAPPKLYTILPLIEVN
ncbi:Alpha subunit of the F1 sector of mitochondrial F1F0 ATP synthase [Onygenales sp. PD_10]|nr:Alpha subunit of the F1 sector of mitochondrial F1F0 ATP synthase [Onygenales sp. PD_10]